jgi:2-aminomuconate deaminase
LYPHAKKVGNLIVFCPALVRRQRGEKKIPGVEQDEKGNIVSYDIEKQCRSVFSECQKPVLEESGSSWIKL